MRHEPNENDIAGCVECGAPLDQRPSSHCSKCLPPPLPDLVGSFPREPAFNSPEAVQQAAETIERPCVDQRQEHDGADFVGDLRISGTEDEGYTVEWRGISEVWSDVTSDHEALCRRIEALLAERDRLRAEAQGLAAGMQLMRTEVERLRGELAETQEKNMAAFKKGSIVMDAAKTEIVRLRDEIERLREEMARAEEEARSLAEEVDGLRDELASERTHHEEDVEERDALAEALEACDWSFGKAQSDEVHEKIESALRKAGRLP